jgi:uroporphyrinogen decarboxylase
MDSRQRLAALLARERPDRVLRDYWAVPEIDRRLRAHYGVETQEELLERLDIDFRYIEGPAYIGPPLEVHGDGIEDDVFGVPRKTMYTGEGEFAGSYKAVTVPPLKEMKTVQEVLDYPKWPSPDWFDYEPVADQCRAVHETGRVAMFMGDRLNRIAQLKPAMYLRGVNQILIDMRRKNNELFVAIRDKIREFYSEYLRRILVAAKGEIDVLVTGDDFGTQNGLFCQPDVWRANLMPGFREYVQIAKVEGVPVMHHSCGSIHPIIGDMIDCGLDILNPIQPLVYDMDHAGLKAEFGDRLIFHGGVSLQGPLRFGTPDGVKQEVKALCTETLGKDGGYIICTAHNIQADTRTENIVALFEAYDEHGWY